MSTHTFRLFLLCAASLSLTTIMPVGASQVTTERIITLPDISAGSGDAPADVTADPDSSGHSTIIRDGEMLNDGTVSAPDNREPDNENGASEIVDQPVPHSGPLPVILRDVSLLPKPVQIMHEALHEAAISGKVEALRPPFEMNEMPPVLNFEEESNDPIEQIRQMSGDEDGTEILAILAEVLESGFVLTAPGTPQEMYVWPYFADYPLSRLDAKQKVELYRLITAGDYAEMEPLDQYIFYRIGIGTDGTWHYFLAGE